MNRLLVLILLLAGCAIPPHQHQPGVKLHSHKKEEKKQQVTVQDVCGNRGLHRVRATPFGTTYCPRCFKVWDGYWCEHHGSTHPVTWKCVNGQYSLRYKSDGNPPIKRK